MYPKYIIGEMADYFEAVLIALNFVLFIWVFVLSILYFTAVRHYKKLQVNNGESLHSALERMYAVLATSHQKHETMLTVINDLHKDSLRHVQKVALKRFNPFGDTGGDQSFSMALLDKYGDGIVLSSLHGRAGTRLYAKPVEKGKAVAYEFSEEELEVVKLALADEED